MQMMLKTSNNYGFYDNEDKQIKKKQIKQIDIEFKYVTGEFY